MASFMGSPGQANYSAANAWLDATALASQSQGGSSTSIQWGAWAGSGMASQDRATLRTVERMGMVLIEPDQGLAALHAVFTNSLPAPVMSAIPFNWSGMVQQAALIRAPVPALFADFTAELETNGDKGVDVGVGVAAAGNDAARRGKGAAMDAMAYQAYVAGEVNAAVNGILGAGSVGPNDALMAAGLDSLGSVELRNALRGRLGAELPSTLVFDYPTVATLTEYLVLTTMPEQTATKEEQVVLGGIPGSGLAFVPSERVTVGLIAAAQRSPCNALSFVSPEGVDAITCVPLARCDVDVAPLVGRFGAVLAGIYLFDAVACGISATEAQLVDPQQRLLLEVVGEVIVGTGGSGHAQKSGVFVGEYKPKYGLINGLLRKIIYF